MSSLDPATYKEGIQTLYVGGGTPSLLTCEQYQQIFNTFRQYLHFSPSAEITLEANPGKKHAETASPLADYLDTGFNRLSVGIQSFNTSELKTLSRTHTAEEGVQFIEKAQQDGWHNISVDLMYALPGQTLDTWQNTLETLKTLSVQHVSMYGLKVEDNTPLSLLSQLKDKCSRYHVPEDDLNVDMYEYGTEQLMNMGFQPYEFSNFARSGYASRHNLNYWNNREFLAFGPSACGYWGGKRYKNIPNLADYCKNPLAGESTTCSHEEQLENALIFGLRKTEGIHISSIEQKYHIDFWNRFGHVVKPVLGSHLAWNVETGFLYFLLAGIPQSNFILKEFLSS